MSADAGWMIQFGLYALLIGGPVICIVLGTATMKGSASRSSKLLLCTGIGIPCIYALLFGGYVLAIGPGRSGIVTNGISHGGREYCIVQTYKDLGEPYQVSFYIRDSAGVWRWNYLAHQDTAWRSASVSFNDGIARVSRDGAVVREIPIPMNTVDFAKIKSGYLDDVCPATFNESDVLSFHNRKFGNL